MWICLTLHKSLKGATSHQVEQNSLHRKYGDRLDFQETRSPWGRKLLNTQHNPHKNIIMAQFHSIQHYLQFVQFTCNDRNIEMCSAIPGTVSSGWAVIIIILFSKAPNDYAIPINQTSTHSLSKFTHEKKNNQVFKEMPNFRYSLQHSSLHKSYFFTSQSKVVSQMKICFHNAVWPVENDRTFCPHPLFFRCFKQSPATLSYTFTTKEKIQTKLQRKLKGEIAIFMYFFNVFNFFISLLDGHWGMHSLFHGLCWVQ